jgi:hypothetical protein
LHKLAGFSLGFFSPHKQEVPFVEIAINVGILTVFSSSEMETAFVPSSQYVCYWRMGEVNLRHPKYSCLIEKSSKREQCMMRVDFDTELDAMIEYRILNAQTQKKQLIDYTRLGPNYPFKSFRSRMLAGLGPTFAILSEEDGNVPGFRYEYKKVMLERYEKMVALKFGPACSCDYHRPRAPRIPIISFGDALWEAINCLRHTSPTGDRSPVLDNHHLFNQIVQHTLRKAILQRAEKNYIPTLQQRCVDVIRMYAPAFGEAITSTNNITRDLVMRKRCVLRPFDYPALSPPDIFF